VYPKRPCQHRALMRYNWPQMVSHLVIPTARNRTNTKGEALDVAARFLLYKLYEAARGTGTAPSWQSVQSLGEAAATVSRAVERGWVVIRDDNQGKAKAKAKDLWAALTAEGRAVARKGLR
jgi:hypothetical protein